MKFFDRFRKKKQREALAIESVKEGPAPEGATCDAPKREAMEAAFKAAGDCGVDLRPLPRCGAPAVVTVSMTYVNGPPTVEHRCHGCSPRGWTGER